MKTIKLPCYGIVVETDGEGGGSIISDLHEYPLDKEDKNNCEKYNASMDGIESIILGHACAGIDITTPAYIEGIETAVQGCADNIDSPDN